MLFNPTFQSAPHFSSEANFIESGFHIAANRFNPRLTSAARRTTLTGSQTLTNKFQSAPHFSSEANPLSGVIPRDTYLFQSAPHFSSEANSVPFMQYGAMSEFQSAPHFSSEA